MKIVNDPCDLRVSVNSHTWAPFEGCAVAEHCNSEGLVFGTLDDFVAESHTDEYSAVRIQTHLKIQRFLPIPLGCSLLSISPDCRSTSDVDWEQVDSLTREADLPSGSRLLGFFRFSRNSSAVCSQPCGAVRRLLREFTRCPATDNPLLSDDVPCIAVVLQQQEFNDFGEVLDMAVQHSVYISRDQGRIASIPLKIENLGATNHESYWRPSVAHEQHGIGRCASAASAANDAQMDTFCEQITCELGAKLKTTMMAQKNAIDSCSSERLEPITSPLGTVFSSYYEEDVYAEEYEPDPPALPVRSSSLQRSPSPTPMSSYDPNTAFCSQSDGLTDSIPPADAATGTLIDFAQPVDPYSSTDFPSLGEAQASHSSSSRPNLPPACPPNYAQISSVQHQQFANDRGDNRSDSTEPSPPRMPDSTTIVYRTLNLDSSGSITNPVPSYDSSVTCSRPTVTDKGSFAMNGDVPPPYEEQLVDLSVRNEPPPDIPSVPQLSSAPPPMVAPPPGFDMNSPGVVQATPAEVRTPPGLPSRRSYHSNTPPPRPAVLDPPHAKTASPSTVDGMRPANPPSRPKLRPAPPNVSPHTPDDPRPSASAASPSRPPIPTKPAARGRPQLPNMANNSGATRAELSQDVRLNRTGSSSSSSVVPPRLQNAAGVAQNNNTQNIDKARKQNGQATPRQRGENGGSKAMGAGSEPRVKTTRGPLDSLDDSPHNSTGAAYATERGTAAKRGRGRPT